MAPKLPAKSRPGGNPYGANQWHKDPRWLRFMSFYLDPKSPTFSNGFQSALKSGFSKNYAESITMRIPEWIRDKIIESSLVLKAENNIKEFLELPSKTQAIGMYGPVFRKDKNGKKIPVVTHNPKLIELKQKTSHFVAERLSRKKWGEGEGDPGSQVNVIIIPDDRIAKIAARIVGRTAHGNKPGTEESR